MKAASALREHIAQFEPDAMRTGRITMEVADGTAISDVIERLGIPVQKRLMLLLDGELVTEPEYSQIFLKDAQLLSINPPIAAG